MGGITTAWKNAWVLPVMSYDIIIDTNWMEVHDLHISFSQKKITVGGQSCDMENVREDLIRECTLIEASEVEVLLKKDKIVEMVVWSLIREKERESIEKKKNVQIKALLEEFADIFSSKLHPPPDQRTHNFCTRTVAETKPQVCRHSRFSK
jgi:hypothetical protein